MKKSEWEKLKDGQLVEMHLPDWGWIDAVVADERQGRGRVKIRFSGGSLGGWRQVEIYPPYKYLRRRPEGKRSRRLGPVYRQQLQDLLHRYQPPVFWRNSLEARKEEWARVFRNL